MPYGLSNKLIYRIKEVFHDFREVEEVILIGSRAKGNHNEGSDIDLVLIGEISHSTMLSIKSALNDLNTPFTFDIIIYSRIKKEALKKHIARVGVPFYKRNEAEEAQ